ncbi:MAG TPA: DUF3471 domain-containing protein [Pyrinomonadaceae bacterium]|jgi:hypothetical protein
MRKFPIFAPIFLVLLFCVAAREGVCLSQTPTAKAENKTARKVSAKTLENYAGRYELGAGIIPVSTLDVTLEGDELWVKPSLVKKRRLIRKSKSVFLDEIEGSPYTFNRDVEGRVVSLTFRFEGTDYTAQKVQLPPPSLKGNTTFRLKGYADAHLVALAGSFNNWNESQLLFGREGDEWVCRIDLETGVYTYKFIVDGNWILDPSNPETYEDDYGNLNNLLTVSKN